MHTLTFEPYRFGDFQSYIDGKPSWVTPSPYQGIIRDVLDFNGEAVEVKINHGTKQEPLYESFTITVSNYSNELKEAYQKF